MRYAPAAVDLGGLRSAVEAAGYEVRGRTAADAAERAPTPRTGLEERPRRASSAGSA